MFLNLGFGGLLTSSSPLPSFHSKENCIYQYWETWVEVQQILYYFLWIEIYFANIALYVSPYQIMALSVSEPTVGYLCVFNLLIVQCSRFVHRPLANMQLVSQSLRGIQYTVCFLKFLFWKLRLFPKFQQQQIYKLSNNIFIGILFKVRFLKQTLLVWCMNMENLHKTWNWRYHSPVYA